ncbi:hypothetical protein A3I95_03535 [Candidatus Nomurabacteria bacterium RIFCSPLOWO2_02_FULL_44_12]|uniref:Uncharacterized protein n=1 Tax=Candidatus Nomurabacteria bacterium RIFCSPLOWO2_12_FULL_44_11 TaxID=1801796 RepID=A0A1F6Y7Q9_9BACT|nr:MAG: hypothetical protein A3G53_00065 [Candidatus Nomurabacteria bacterium RIFCSPLOWO2_12_FULL_44_11]OGJ08722.1 MAG: hypothetical protein A3I95_03535 [Candidatus Nomurabacteria bacterium RIFCSPLOWO2_02_FULL_44_12]
MRPNGFSIRKNILVESFLLNMCLQIDGQKSRYRKKNSTDYRQIKKKLLETSACVMETSTIATAQRPTHSGTGLLEQNR